jgi:putative peptide maturation system protein
LTSKAPYKACTERDCFGHALADAVTLLRNLPRRRGAVSAAREQFLEWRQRHQGQRADWLIDQPPGSLDVDYDLLLEHPEGGTLALTWRPDEVAPWSVCYADHWAANFVVTVNGHSITIQQALRMLRMAFHRHPHTQMDLVTEALLMQIIDRDKALVSEGELQAASDRFRRAMGLNRAADMIGWLAEMNLAQAEFENLLETTVRIRKLRQRIVADRIDDHFTAKREAYDRVCFFEVSTTDKQLAERMAAEALETGMMRAMKTHLRKDSTIGLAGTLTTRFAGTLPQDLQMARIDLIVGPYQRDDQYCVSQIHARRSAVLDEETREAAGDAVFREWLAEQTAAATIQWHWS